MVVGVPVVTPTTCKHTSTTGVTERGGPSNRPPTTVVLLACGKVNGSNRAKVLHGNKKRRCAPDAARDFKEEEMAEGYCVKCKEKTEMKDSEEVEMKNKRKALKGTCEKCGTKMFKILGKS